MRMEKHGCWSRRMGRALLVAGFLLLFVVTGAMAVHAAPPSLIVQYNFDGDLDDALDNSTLTPFGTANDGFNRNNATSGFDTDSDGTYWYWTSTLSRGGGFWIDIGENISANYSIGVRFSFNIAESGYRKIIDYKNSASDNGFYFYGGGRLNFYPYGTLGATYIRNNQTVDIVSTRAADGTFTAYLVVDGVLQKELEVNDSGGYAMPTLVDGKPRFGFFFDDRQTGSEATNGGKVYSIRIWNGPITEDQIGSAMNTVAYNGNGQTGGTPPVDASSYAAGDEVTVLANTSLVKADYVFAGWNTSQDGTGTAYLPDSTFTMGSTGVTLYAVWEEDDGGEPPAEPEFTVTYDGNGGTRGEVPVDSSLYEEGDTVTVLGNTEGLGRSRYAFRGWNTQADGRGTRYREGDTFVMGDGDVVLYAQWRRISTSDEEPASVTEPEEVPVIETEEAEEPAIEEKTPFSAHFFLNRTDYRVTDREYEMDAVPLVREGRVLLPLRYAAYAVGIAPEQIQWDPEQQVVTVDTGKVLLRVVIGSSFMEINGEPIPLEVPAEIVGGRTLLPLRALSEALGYEVLWLEETKEVVIR